MSILKKYQDCNRPCLLNIDPLSDAPPEPHASMSPCCGESLLQQYLRKLVAIVSFGF